MQVPPEPQAAAAYSFLAGVLKDHSLLDTADTLLRQVGGEQCCGYGVGSFVWGCLYTLWLCCAVLCNACVML